MDDLQLGAYILALVALAACLWAFGFLINLVLNAFWGLVLAVRHLRGPRRAATPAPALPAPSLRALEAPSQTYWEAEVAPLEGISQADVVRRPSTEEVLHSALGVRRSLRRSCREEQSARAAEARLVAVEHKAAVLDALFARFKSHMDRVARETVPPAADPEQSPEGR